MSSPDEEIQTNLEILKALNDAIEKGPWKHSPFFRGIGKKLENLRNRFIQESGLEGVDLEQLHLKTIESNQPDDYLNIYILLYQSEGINIRKWFNVVISLVEHSTSRPVYKNEEDVKAAIRAKENKQNDAYIEVKVRKQDIYPTSNEKPRIDRDGRELLLLHDGAIHLKNVTRFVHISGDYTLGEHSLIKLIK